MARKTYLYYLFGRNKKPLYKQGNAILEGTENYFKQDGVTNAELLSSPEGWQSSLIKYARNLKYWGLFRTFTVPMKFVKDGAAILQSQFHKFGYEAIAYMGIMRFDQITIPYQYKGWYLSELNFTKYNEAQNSVTIEALEGGFSKYLKANENTTYEIPVDEDPEYVQVVMDGMELGNTGEFTITDGLGATDPNIDFGNHLVDLIIVSKEVEDIGGVFDVPRTKVDNNNPHIFDTGRCFYEASTTTTITIEYDFDLNVDITGQPPLNPAAQLFVVVRALDPVTKTVTPDHQITLLNLLPGHILGVHRIVGTAQLTVPTGYKCFLYTGLTVTGAGGSDTTAFRYTKEAAKFKITYAYRHPQTVIKGLTPLRLAELLVAKMSNGECTVKSAFLQSLSDSIVISSGDAVRGNSPAVIKTNFADFFQWTQFFSTGLGAKDTVCIVEKIEDFFQEDVAVELGPVAEATLYPAEDMLGNKVVAGYGKQDYEGINGKFEVNQGQQWTLPVVKVTKDVVMNNSYRADPFGIELLRINFGKLKTTDSKSDNDTVVLNVSSERKVYENVFVDFIAPNVIVVPQEFTSLLKRGDQITLSGTQGNDNRYTIINSEQYITYRRLTLDGVIMAQQPGAVKITVLSGLKTLYRPALSQVSGVLYPGSLFNALLSPKIGLLNNGRLLHSLLDKLDGKNITLASADKNTDLAYTFNGTRHVEKDPIAVGALPPKLFLPTYIKVKTEVDVNVPALLNAKPYSKISFIWSGRTWYAFLFDGSVKDATREEQEWILLSAPENDLSKFNSYE